MNNEEQEYGSYHKLWFAISLGLTNALDYLTVAAVVSGVLAVLIGTQYYVAFFATAGISLLLRLAITAFNWKTARYLPMDTEYRVTLVEDKLSALDAKIESLKPGIRGVT
jgi:hypothetical protein